MGFAAGSIDEKFRNSCSTPICSPELHAEVEELSTAVSAGTYATEGGRPHARSTAPLILEGLGRRLARGRFNLGETYQEAYRERRALIRLIAELSLSADDRIPPQRFEP